MLTDAELMAASKKWHESQAKLNAATPIFDRARFVALKAELDPWDKVVALLNATVPA